MDQLTLLSITSLLCIAVLIVLIMRQQRTIDKLTDKLMAKDYSEYKRHRESFQDTKDVPKPRKPMSFHDDPNIELQDDSVN